jgi:UDP-2,3-diacylglucosamine pyrophosphatase LpxH
MGRALHASHAIASTFVQLRSMLGRAAPRRAAPRRCVCHWPQARNDLVHTLLRKSRKSRKLRKGTKVIFVPGNHDEFARR